MLFDFVELLVFEHQDDVKSFFLEAQESLHAGVDLLADELAIPGDVVLKTE